MKKIYKLNKKLRKIEEFESQIKNFKSLSEIPITKFIMYRHVKNAKKKICREIECIKRFAKGTELLYKYEVGMWLKNPAISGKAYCKLEEKARYRRDLKLYKLGFTNKKPQTILQKKISSIIPKINISENYFINKIQGKFKNFESNVLPQKTNKLAVNTAKRIIKGYRNIQSQYRYYTYSLAQNNSIQYMRGVINEACREIKNEAILMNNVTPYTEEGRRFRERLRFSPKKDIKIYNSNNKNDNKTKNIKLNTNSIAMEYEM